MMAKHEIDGTEAIEGVRRAVLDALDRAAQEVLLKRPFTPRADRQGWKDEDLPKLFKAIDAHTEVLALRMGVTLSD